MPGRVGEQVADDLYDAPPVRHHQGQVRLYVKGQGGPAPGVLEGAPGPVHQQGHLRRFRVHRQRPRLDASHVQQVADEFPHVIGPVHDDALKLAQLRRVQSAAASSTDVAAPGWRSTES